MRVVGICRFSLVGRGDWKAYQGKSDSEIEAVALEQAARLFTPERMEARLATFEHLTIASLKAQADPEFIFVVLASQLMPQEYRTRLERICASCPQVVLRFFPIMGTGTAQRKVFEELGLNYQEVLQFRLDDDDCVCVDYIKTLKKCAAGMMILPDPFAASFRGVMFSALHGPVAGVYNWQVAFFSAGAALRHPRQTIFAFGHFGLPRRFPSLVIPGRMALVTHMGNNDTDVLNNIRVKKQGMVRMTGDAVRESQKKHFPFLDETGKSIAGISQSRLMLAG